MHARANAANAANVRIIIRIEILLNTEKNLSDIRQIGRIGSTHLSGSSVNE